MPGDNSSSRFNAPFARQGVIFVSGCNRRRRASRTSSFYRYYKCSGKKTFKNTIQLLTYYRDINNLEQITDYVISLLLYYGLSENFTKHTYELYLKEFVHAIDDFSKGIKIEQDDETYRNLNVEKVNIPKKQYMIIDVADPKVNITNNVGEAYIQELRKFKKIILKLLEAKVE